MTAIVIGVVVLAVIAAVTTLLIWALNERKKKHKAETALVNAHQVATTAKAVADNNVKVAHEARDQVARLESQVAALRGRLNEARMRLAQSADPAAIKDWLDKETEAETL